MSTIFSQAYTSLDVALQEIAATSTTLVVSMPLNCPNTKTIPSTITLQFMGGGYLDLTTGKTITINGPILAPPVKIFNNALSGQGTVVINSHDCRAWFEWWGAVADGSTNNYAAMVAAMAATKHVQLGNGSYVYNTLLALPSNFTLSGLGEAGSFLSVLRPNNCQAFSVSGIHHTLVEGLMIWPLGTTPPAYHVRVTNSYSVKLRDIRIHVDSTGRPATIGTISQDTSGGGANNDILYENVAIRSEDESNWHNKGMIFGNDCGSAMVLYGDIETCNTNGIDHSGGRITVVEMYMEQQATNGINVQPSGDAMASLAILGGVIASNASGIPLTIRDGAKNLMVVGTKMERNGGTYDAYIYGLSGSANVVLDPANVDMTVIGAGVSVDPTVVRIPKTTRIPSKFTSINVTMGTMSAGWITGADYVSLMSTNATPGTQTTRTAAQLIADHGTGILQAVYTLRITNTAAGTFTLGAGANVTSTGTMTIAGSTWRDFIVTLNGSAGTATIQSIGTGTYS